MECYHLFPFVQTQYFLTYEIGHALHYIAETLLSKSSILETSSSILDQTLFMVVTTVTEHGERGLMFDPERKFTRTSLSR